MSSNRPRSFKHALQSSGAFSEEELSRMTRAFEIIGDIAIVEIPEGFESKANDIGYALLSLYPNVRVVARKASPVQGELRTRKLEVIAGEDRTVTEHKENNIRLRVDVEGVYFSPRLSGERLRVAQQVKPGENVLVLFAGVGPYPVVIARMQPTAHVVSNELNELGTKYALENMRLNKIEDRVEVVGGDARKLLHEPRFAKWADRVVMPLPESADQFLDDVMLVARPGCVVHFYAFGPSAKGEDPYAASLEKIEAACKKAKRNFEVLNKQECGTYAPRIARIVMDFKLLD